MKHTRIIALLLVVLALATPVLAQKPGSTTSMITDFVSHTDAFIPMGPMLLSRCSGKSSGKYYVEWPRHDVCVFTATFDALGNHVGSAAGVKPSGMQADRNRVKELCNSDELCDDPILSVTARNGAITSLHFLIQDDIGRAGVQHESETVILDAPAQTNPCGFVVHVHRDNVPVWELAGHTGGPRVEIVGTISIGDVWYRPATPCSN